MLSSGFNHCSLVLKKAVAPQPNVLHAIFRGIRDFPGEIGHFTDPKISPDDLKRRIYADEFQCFSSSQKNGFTANQIGVNRPVEDRWSAFRIGMVADSTQSFFPPDHPILLAAEGFPGGHIYTVVDGHGGHTCAHAVNLLHADYLCSSLSPPESLEHLLRHLQDLDGRHKPCELVEQCWIRARAKAHDGSPITWGPHGPWGSLDTGVTTQHGFHLRRYIEEALSLNSFEHEDEMYLQENEQGDLCDPEGNVVVCQSDSEDNSAQLARISSTVKYLRDGLTRLDQDITQAAMPSSSTTISTMATGHRAFSSASSRAGILNKSLLRIVMSGCVLSSVYVPQNKSELFAMQVGDCATVLGSSKPNASMSSYNAKDWQAKLLVPMHNAQNVKEIKRLRQEHPLHEADFIIRDDRLLGELMPFRAFGDIRLKWPADVLKKVAALLDLPPNYPVHPHFYHSPPYLTCMPQVVWHPINLGQRDCRPLDRFIILGTDGLWDMVSPDEAVHVVAKHLIDYQNEPWKATSGDSAASRLVRSALGGEEMDPLRISVMLSVPANIARYYRDDISVVVVYLHCEP